jgi:hypothetical protein
MLFKLIESFAKIHDTFFMICDMLTKYVILLLSHELCNLIVVSIMKQKDNIYHPINLFTIFDFIGFLNFGI